MAVRNPDRPLWYLLIYQEWKAWLYLLVYRSIVQFGQLGIVPPVGGAYQIAGDALQLVHVLAAAFGTYLQIRTEFS